jgi:hypothetical protein
VTAVDYAALRAAVMRSPEMIRYGKNTRWDVNPDVRERYKRRLSNAIAAELRRRGLLCAEGYAPGSWAAL